MLKEKTSPNWLFGLGYLFVASIILMNYISQKTEVRVPSTSDGKTMTSSYKNEPDQDILKSQLNEERRINREMSEMINNLQTAIKYSQGYDFSGGGGSGSVTLPNELTFDEILKNGLPNLIHVSLPAKMVPINSATKRNPFLPYYEASNRETKVQKEVIASPIQPSIFKLKTDPKVPLPLQNTWNVPIIFESESQSQLR